MAQLGLDFPTSWGRNYSTRFLRNAIQGWFLTPLMKHMSSLEVRGKENLEGDAPFIFVANHTSHLDTPLIIAALPPKLRKRLVVAAAMDNFFMKRRVAVQTVIVFNGIPIDRHKINRRSSQLALELVEDHWNLLIFPEGGRSPDGDMQEFKGGAAYLAERSGATVIPTYIHDAGYLRGPKYAKAPQFVNAPYKKTHEIIVAFGPPLRSEPDENIRKFGARIEEAVEVLGREVSGNPNYGVRDTPDES
jgi:1-acyl-sn-glycerol-3-phosphate acyltransferase